MSLQVVTVKRLCLNKLPPVLVIQLKRFEYDFEKVCAIKFNDYFEFPRELDVEPYTGEILICRKQTSYLELSSGVPKFIEFPLLHLNSIAVLFVIYVMHLNQSFFALIVISHSYFL